MKFSWDDAKSDRNLRERGLSFEAAVAMFDGKVLAWEDLRRDYGERRMRAVGQGAGGLLHCVYTDRDEVRRIISLRAANRRERDAYGAAYPL